MLHLLTNRNNGGIIGVPSIYMGYQGVSNIMSCQALLLM
jgi:hypothetical protein